MSRIQYTCLGLALVGALVALLVFQARNTRAPTTPSPEGIGDPVASDHPVLKSDSNRAEGGIRITVGVRALVGETLSPLPRATVVALPRPTAEQASPEEAIAAVERDRVITETDTSGEATVLLAREGDWKIRVLAPGFLGQDLQVDARALRSAPRVDFELTALARIRGSIRMKSGAVVDSAQVDVRIRAEAHRRMAMLHPSDSHPSRRIQQLSKSDGKFDFPVILPGESITLIVTKRGAGRRVTKLDPLEPGEDKLLSIELAEPTVLIGKVAPPWEPDKARLTVECFHRQSAGLTAEQRVKVQDDGTFRLVDLEPGRKQLIYQRRSSEGATFGFLEVDALAEETIDAGTITPAGSSLRLIVLPEGGVPEPRRVELYGSLVRNDAENTLLPVATPLMVPTEVEFEIAGLPLGRLTLTARMRDRLGKEADREFKVATHASDLTGSDESIELVLKRESRAEEGRILVTVVPPEGVERDALDIRLALVRDDKVVDAFGKIVPGNSQFRVGPHPPGDYEVLAVANGHQSPPRAVTLIGGQTTLLRLADWSTGAAVSGTVENAAGEPVNGALVIVLGPAVDKRSVRWPVYETKTDATGKFTMSSLPLIEGLRLHAESAEGFSPEHPVDARAGASDLRIRVGK